MKDRLRKGVAAGLAFALGGFGAHRFYLEQHGRGVAYLLLSWTFVPLLLGVRDGLRLLLMTPAAFDDEFNKPSLILTPHSERPAVPLYAPAPVQVTVVGAGGDRVSQLEKLASLREKGVISDEEFAAQKVRLLSHDQ